MHVSSREPNTEANMARVGVVPAQANAFTSSTSPLVGRETSFDARGGVGEEDDLLVECGWCGGRCQILVGFNVPASVTPSVTLGPGRL